jgi:hypothetical protein
MAKKRPVADEGLSDLWMTILKVVGALVLVGLVLGGAWFFSSMGPNRVKYSHADYQYEEEIPASVTALLDKSQQLEREFRTVEKNGAVTAADLPKLQEAIKLQQQYLQQTGHDLTEGNDRLTDLETSLQNYQTDPMRKQSLDLEETAADEADAGKGADAITALQKAFDLQEQVNENYPLTKNRDFARVAMIQHRIGFLTAQPLNEESQAAEEAAQAALAKEDWGAAQVDFQRAYDLQSQINRDFPDQQFTNIAREEDLSNQLISLRSTGTHRQVESLLAQAQAAAADPLKAAGFLQDALREQRDLIKNYPQSRFADQALAETIETNLQTALSQPVADEITHQAEALATALRNRHCQEARDEVAILVQKVESFRENFPRSPLLQGDLEQRLEYINFKGADLADIQDKVYALLLPLPGQKDWQLLKEEVPQSLYQAVIGGNPSRNMGLTLPVDSVSWDDAREFCRHLEWVLARPVRLPQIAEFQLALGKVDTLDVAAATWNLDNSGGHTQAVATKAANAAGYYDLLGNVAEWLDRPADADEGKAPLAGGNAQTPVDAIRDTTVTYIAEIDRSRFTGFRIAVDMDEAAPMPTVELATPTMGKSTTDAPSATVGDKSTGVPAVPTSASVAAPPAAKPGN